LALPVSSAPERCIEGFGTAPPPGNDFRRRRPESGGFLAARCPACLPLPIDAVTISRPYLWLGWRESPVALVTLRLRG
jgi:hypothetical protein